MPKMKLKKVMTDVEGGTRMHPQVVLDDLLGAKGLEGHFFEVFGGKGPRGGWE